MARPLFRYDPQEAGLGDETPARVSKIGKDPTKQVSQSEYNRILKEQKAKADAAYQRYKNNGKNLGKYLYPKSKGK